MKNFIEKLDTREDCANQESDEETMMSLDEKTHVRHERYFRG